jgi:hypothetical protein
VDAERRAREWVVYKRQVLLVDTFVTPSEDQERWASYLIGESRREMGYDRSARMDAETEFILEPLKVRTITKGPPAVYAYAKDFQKSLHGVMRTLDPFRLIGKTIAAEDVQSIRTTLLGAVWHSIDYRAATDRLHLVISADILNLILKPLERFYEDECDIIRASLAPHRVGYRCLSRVEEMTGVPVPPLARVWQKNGQLMGSPTSFPILCLVNYATVLLADLEFFGAEQAALLKDLVLINGDDCLVHRPFAWRAVHERIAASCGLAYSAGKSYSSPFYANMNSVGFWDWEGVVREVTYYPVAAVLGLGVKKGLSRCHCDDKTIVTTAFEAMRRALAVSTRPKWTLKCLIRHRLDELRKQSSWRNWFLPTTLGGMGVEPPTAWTWRITPTQLDHVLACFEAAEGSLDVRPLRRAEIPMTQATPFEFADGLVVAVHDKRFLRDVPKATGQERPRTPRADRSTLIELLPPGWRGTSVAYSIGPTAPGPGDHVALKQN